MSLVNRVANFPCGLISVLKGVFGRTSLLSQHKHIYFSFRCNMARQEFRLLSQPKLFNILHFVKVYGSPYTVEHFPMAALIVVVCSFRYCISVTHVFFYTRGARFSFAMIHPLLMGRLFNFIHYER